jgi:hypothetical protein
VLLLLWSDLLGLLSPHCATLKERQHTEAKEKGCVISRYTSKRGSIFLWPVRFHGTAVIVVVRVAVLFFFVVVVFTRYDVHLLVALKPNGRGKKKYAAELVLVFSLLSLRICVGVGVWCRP